MALLSGMVVPISLKLYIPGLVAKVERAHDDSNFFTVPRYTYIPKYCGMHGHIESLGTTECTICGLCTNYRWTGGLN